jgi:hypothetical protein
VLLIGGMFVVIWGEPSKNTVKLSPRHYENLGVSGKLSPQVSGRRVPQWTSHCWFGLSAFQQP